jgi:hypothetical protein
MGGTVMLLEKIYGELRDMWMVESQYEFSRFWLGQSRSYMSCAKTRQRQPSLLVLMRLSQRLASISSKYAAVATTETERDNCHRLVALRDQVGDAVGHRSMS